MHPSDWRLINPGACPLLSKDEMISTASIIHLIEQSVTPALNTPKFKDVLEPMSQGSAGLFINSAVILASKAYTFREIHRPLGTTPLASCARGGQ